MLAEELPRVILRRAGKEGLDVLRAVIDHVAKVTALLLLVPVPSENGREPRVNRNARAPVIERRQPFYDNGATLDVVEHPVDRCEIVRERQITVSVLVPRRGHVLHAVDAWREELEAVLQLRRSPHKRIEERRCNEDRDHNRGHAPTAV